MAKIENIFAYIKKTNSMRIKLLMILLAAVSSVASAQKVTNGPPLDNDKTNKMNRMLEGDDESFYTYRVRSKGKGTSYFVEKYNKASLKPEFSKEVDIEEDRYTKVEDVKYAGGMVYIFIRQYNKDADKMTLFYRTVSSKGMVSPKFQEFLNVKSDHYEFVDFEIYPNPSKTKFLVKACHKANKEDSYKTDFVFFDASTMKKLNSKQVDQKLSTGASSIVSFMFNIKIKPEVEFIGLMFDDADNIYYGYTSLAKNSNEKEKRFKLFVNLLFANETGVKTIELGFDEDYYVGDVEFAKTNGSELIIGGFLKDVIERKGRDLVKVGIFSFTVDINKSAIASQRVKLFDDKILASLESNAKRSRYFKYKLDYMIPIGGDIYYVGEQYREQVVTTYNSSTRSSQTYYDYEYMDVIIAKLNPKGEFEWVKNTPLRIEMRLNAPHIFKQYIAVPSDKNIYILNDEHPKNLERYDKADFEPKDLKGMSGIHGTNFVCSTVPLGNEPIVHKLVFVNEDYCFAPIQERNPSFMPPSDTENFVKGKGNEIYIYTEDRGKDRFSKITFD